MFFALRCVRKGGCAQWQPAAVCSFTPLMQARRRVHPPQHYRCLPADAAACRWPAQRRYSSSQVLHICSGLASALSYLHSKGVCHGDVYAHNIMLEGEAHAVLCDFGAAFCYDHTAAGGFWEAMEVRAFGLFMEGLLQHTDDASSNGSCCAGGASLQSDEAAGVLQQLHGLLQQCIAVEPADRLSFVELQQQLEALKQ